ncbi:hypothetical protein COW36_07600 [bacterium (Candidatus Blackallbacteria) CG17_big_fil_post_rev_8_21_14_2_50_48_46]|uniref:Uncharacterized protein n=1 Tax=bacterium (Candidatus Blackallbacteria) CG17_big_fil_post_rev_8_21_14_2_50_48_46 TaxID=2014261 RepID=A0A2M7G6P4_9BACT|nr:MAG: hypothetical protein COW64_06305 [bacterium (Candidatus Blackallbacteria) CG18_big_fil_WC_8_21_14_2_50_49_26]PIW17704.1 MAG: hypothetical protein COW36_07600 [bacterium (Candidatus Blackallbacteria) CG17_big_fil_post_rev_8_21_14_2_50_48_46]PIW47520.1 MAG: hypothetical protein COW20_12345 [bacterium (Candidatus Blackallbacteria) CG13_big_fil_rev_8_21_14_2_50_49_14]
MLKRFFIVGLSGLLVFLSFLMNNQKLFDYYTPDLILGLGLGGLAFAMVLGKGMPLALLRLLKREFLEAYQLQQLLASFRHAWRFLLCLTGFFYLLQTLQILTHAGDKKALAYLGTWLALSLLGGLYLILLRWAVFLPLQAAVQKRLLSEIQEISGV